MIASCWQQTIKDVMRGNSMNTVTIVTPNGSVPFKQDWDDQVVAPGLSYKEYDALTARVGCNYGKNPIPSHYGTYLWPAIVERYYTAGLGYVASAQTEINFELVYVPKMSVTGTGLDMSLGGNGGMQIKHSQLNAQIMCSYKL